MFFLCGFSCLFKKKERKDRDIRSHAATQIGSNIDTFISATDCHPSYTAHSDRTPCTGSTLGQLLVDFWSDLVKNDQNRPKPDQKPTENRLKIDPVQDLDRRLPLRRGGESVAEIKVLAVTSQGQGRGFAFNSYTFE